MTTKAAPARPPPRGTGDECSSVRERTEIKEKKKMSSRCNWWESSGGDGGQEIITPLCEARRRGRSEE